MGGVVGGVCAIISSLVLLVIYYKKSTRVKYPDFGRTYEGTQILCCNLISRVKLSLDMNMLN